MLVLSELVHNAKRVWQLPPVVWSVSEPTAAELAAAEKEATADNFDTLGLKNGVWNAWKRGEYECVCKTAGLVRVIVFAPKGVEPPWEFWGRVFQWFGPASWKVVWFAADVPRCFPSTGEVGPEHVNGGYTTGCSTNGIYIYRKEEATRVLIHELMHAACLNEPGWEIPRVEAMVETWAELILIALKSKGVATVAKSLWAKQAQWVSNSNRVARANAVHDESDYAWRYLVGREEMYARLGMALPVAMGHPSKSTRFTDPVLEV